MNRNKRRMAKLLALFLTIILVAGTGTVYAKSSTGEAASSLTVYLTAGGETKLLHEYSVAEMENLMDGKGICYSSIDALPARVLTVADGVYISTLISDAGKYTDYKTEDFTKLKMTATDGWFRTYTKEKLSQTQYYYKDLFSSDTWDSAKATAGASAAEHAVVVKPMLAVSSWQGRILENTDDVSSKAGDKTRDAMFRLCLGMNAQDLTSGQSTTSEYGRWVNQLELFLEDAAAGDNAASNNTAQNNTDNRGNAGALVWKNGFSDVGETDWFYPAVSFVNSRNLFQGTDADSFSPGLKMTRGMFVTVLGRMAKADTSSYQNSFQDVISGRYYENYVAWATGNQIISGYGKGKFGPDDTVTREQMALIIYRYAKQMKLNVSDTDSSKCQTFSDYGSVMSGAKEAVCWAVNNGIMAGTNGKLDPKGEATRAQVAQIMKNFADKEASL